MILLLRLNLLIAIGSGSCYVVFDDCDRRFPQLREPLFTQVARIVGSEVLRGSESLCHLLEFLASHAISNPGNPVKEYQIATEVFGRSEKFDPRLDSAVRVQTSRLRAKLAEYYAGPGAGDPMVIEIPKGAYSLTVHEKAAPEPPAIPAPPPPYREPARPARPGAAAWFLGILCLGQCAAILYMLTRPPKPAAEVQPLVPPALRALWDPFIESHERSWIVFSNAEFVGRPETGMRYLNPATDKSSPILDHYTGVGEVMAIHELDRLFAQFRRSVVVKRGRLLAMDDVKNNDVVFVGSPSENLALRDMPALQDFVFGRTPEVTFVHPSGSRTFIPRPASKPCISHRPGCPSRRIMR